MITRERAREIAAQWHGGQWSPLYMFASSGCVSDARYTVGDVMDETLACLSESVGVVSDARELGALIEWIECHPNG